ncbi:MAG TPA: DsbA family protein, partial [Rhodospirillales bacterium]|nr:DsbA family protein [Rhodospirillales bacterium]
MAAEEVLSPRQKQAVEGVVRDYLTHNPEVLVEAIRALR